VKPRFSFNPKKSTPFFEFWIEVVSKPQFFISERNQIIKHQRIECECRNPQFNKIINFVP
jgi:hypothetical protein